MAEKDFREYDAEVFDSSSGKHITTIMAADRCTDKIYPVGGEIILSDYSLYQNNSKRHRKCKIDKSEEVSPNHYQLFITPTKETIASIDITRLLDEGNDTSGYDGWLKP